MNASMENVPQPLQASTSNNEKRLVNMAETQVCKTELAYVTGIDKEAVSFFVQLCKFTNDELMEHNTKIHEFCKALAATMKQTQQSGIVNPKPGDVLCARYAVDGNWYRVVVKSYDEAARECQVYFSDYGNIETISYNNLIEVNPAQLPAIERAPFGFYCKLKDSEKYPNKDKLLRALHEEYVMLKPLERLDFNLWRVILPNVAYNQGFVNSMQQANKA